MSSVIRQFLETYYIQPIIHDSGYNPVNTISWALLFALVLLLVLKLLNKLRVEIDRHFIAAVVPYILVGSSLRVMEDAGLFQPPLRYLMITPLIYLCVFFCAVPILVISVKLSGTSKRYNLYFGIAGMIWLFADMAILLLSAEELILPGVILAVLGITSIITGIIYTIATKFRLKFLTEKLNISVLAVHLLDASSTYIGIDLLGRYTGKHVIEELIVKYTGSAVWMYLLKLGVLVPGLYLLDTLFHEEDRALKNIILLALIVIGLGPAVRNTLRMAFGI
ncbi:MAG: DUF63 family protein [Halobacteriota archaeon]